VLLRSASRSCDEMSHLELGLSPPSDLFLSAISNGVPGFLIVIDWSFLMDHA